VDSQYGYRSAGDGVYAYIVDTGVLETHTDFAIVGGGSRVTSGKNIISSTASPRDDNGHGTHIAGTIGGNKYGVAKAVALVPVKVLNSRGGGSMSQVAAGISWAVNDPRVPNSKKVINLSLGTDGRNTELDTAVAAAVKAGVVTVVAAANSAKDSCLDSPDAVPEAITVGSIDNTDAIASFSNFGPCIDLFAPGVQIVSDWFTGTSATNTLDGCSMAAPHVVGVVARILSTGECTDPACVASAVSTQAMQGRVKGSIRNAPNRIIHRERDV